MPGKLGQQEPRLTWVPSVERWVKVCLWDKGGGLLSSEAGRLPATPGSLFCSQLLSDSAAWAQCTTRTSGGRSSPSSALSPPWCGRYHLPRAAKACSQLPEGERHAGRDSGTRSGNMWLGRSGENWGEQAWRSIQATSGNRKGPCSGKGLSCGLRSGEIW